MLADKRGRTGSRSDAARDSDDRKPDRVGSDVMSRDKSPAPRLSEWWLVARQADIDERLAPVQLQSITLLHRTIFTAVKQVTAELISWQCGYCTGFLEKQ